MVKNNESIKCYTLSEMKEILRNDYLAEYLFNFGNKGNLSSTSEITVIAYIMSFFKPLSFTKIAGTNVLINGVHGRFVVNFQLQEKIYNPRSKKSLSIDLTVKLYTRHSKEFIAKIGVEYDGHHRHMTSYGILEDKEKDLVVLKQTGMPRIRVQPQMYQKEEDKKDIYRSIKKYFEQFTKFHSKGRNSSVSGSKFMVCPLCEGVQIMGAESCPVCIGDGSLLKDIYFGIDVDVFYSFDSFDCPDCSKRSNKSCRKCRGNGYLSREDAIKIRLEDLNKNS
ncbi:MULTISPECIES: hypothetical protein [Enterobacteriaceae]|uniref:hypothetical protein n=1 Tax=Enterobacteriaceae TaxID=543 RepID=UPI0010130B06|nr:MULTISPECIES: hypothetical protein [Enterobacteriaceae]ELY6080367.1 hypothetical protein [Cronobacter sakazakii]MCI0198723.1 hypothetical protein [Cronobacter sakazakii]RXX50656.1 hypothetical protein DD604_07295 [Enterobacter cloacae]